MMLFPYLRHLGISAQWSLLFNLNVASCAFKCQALYLLLSVQIHYSMQQQPGELQANKIHGAAVHGSIQS